MHFGIVVTVNLAIGLFHPPFGINIFVAQSVLGIRLESIYRGILPFLVIYLVALAIITVQWVVVGYSLAFGPDHGGLIGGLDAALLRDQFVGARAVWQPGSLKTMVVRSDGHIGGSASVDLATQSPQPRWSEQDPQT